jgi:hypothetical protein
MQAKVLGLNFVALGADASVHGVREQERCEGRRKLSADG